MRCLVPFCRCNTRLTCFDEWVCPKHWGRTDRTLRLLLRRVRRKIKRRGFDDSVVLRGIEVRAWLTLRTQAIERAVGIG